MYIFLILWFLFLFAYIIFNVYGLYRVQAMRMKGDVTGRAILLYIIVMLVIISSSIFLISHLDWGRDLSQIFK